MQILRAPDIRLGELHAIHEYPQECTDINVRRRFNENRIRFLIIFDVSALFFVANRVAWNKISRRWIVAAVKSYDGISRK